MRETSPFSAKQVIQTRKEKKIKINTRLVRGICFATIIHTYIYFIYTRNLQSSCRANIFEKISKNKIKYAVLQFQ